MNKDAIKSIVRQFATVGGAWLAGHFALGGNFAASLAGFAAAAVGFGWTMIDKQDRPSREMWEGLLRHAVFAFGGAAVALGWIQEAQVSDLAAAAVTLGAFLWGPISKLNRGET